MTLAMMRMTTTATTAMTMATLDNVNDGSGVSVTWEEGDDHSVFVLLLLLMSYPSRHHHTIVVKMERL